MGWKAGLPSDGPASAGEMEWQDSGEDPLSDEWSVPLGGGQRGARQQPGREAAARNGIAQERPWDPVGSSADPQRALVAEDVNCTGTVRVELRAGRGGHCLGAFERLLPGELASF